MNAKKLFLLSSCYSNEDLVGTWVVYETKSSFEGKINTLTLESPFEFKIINDRLVVSKNEENDSLIIGKLNSEQKTLMFPSDCCAVCFQFKQRKNKLYFENYLGVKCIAHKVN